MQSLRAQLTRPASLFLLLTLLGYGLLLPYTGFYWDDWPFAWIAKFLGPAEFIPAFLPFRPFLGPIFYATTSLIPPVPLYWQVFALVIRFLIGLSAWWTFKQIHPGRPRFALTIALLITVFPGYSQHWVAFTHINQELIPFIFYILSLGFTFKAFSAERPLPYILIALLLQICGIYPTEYFFGMEVLRLLFIFFHGADGLSARIRRTLGTWWPYLLVWISNALWLVYYYRFGPYNSYGVTATSDGAGINYLAEIGDTLWKVCFYIWGQILVLLSANIFGPSYLLTSGLIVLTFLLLILYLPQLSGQSEPRTFAWTLIAIGLAGILFGRLPSLAAGLPLNLQTTFDRFMISMTIGGSLFITGLVELMVRNGKYRTLIFMALIALGVGQQFFNANSFRRDWEKQQQIYWQLSWRIPALTPDTLLLAHQLPVEYETDLSLTAPVNWMYAAELSPPQLPYALLFTEKRIGGGKLPTLDPNLSVSFDFRTMRFNGSTSQTVMIYMPVSGCLRVLDPSRGDAKLYAKQPDTLVKAIPLSDPDWIIPNPIRAASPVFLGDEPEHAWCYYFTKAELAFQTGDLEKVKNLETQAAALGYAPEDQNEWLIFIAARALTGDIPGAQELSERIVRENIKVRRGVCVTWDQIQAGGGAGDAGRVADILSALQCH